MQPVRDPILTRSRAAAAQSGGGSGFRPATVKEEPGEPPTPADNGGGSSSEPFSAEGQEVSWSLEAPLAKWFFIEEDSEDDMEGSSMGAGPAKVVKFTGSNWIMTVSELSNLVYQRPLLWGRSAVGRLPRRLRWRSMGCCGTAAMVKLGYCSTTISRPGLTVTGRQRTCSWRRRRARPGNGPTTRIQQSWRPWSRPRHKRRRRRHRQQRRPQPLERGLMAPPHRRHHPSQRADPPQRPCPRFNPRFTMFHQRNHLPTIPPF
jgi:hypothetical protein